MKMTETELEHYNNLKRNDIVQLSPKQGNILCPRCGEEIGLSFNSAYLHFVTRHFEVIYPAIRSVVLKGEIE